MRRIFTIISVVACTNLLAQTESYTALKVEGEFTPRIDGTIEPIWDEIQIVPIEKVPKQGGVIHSNITVESPSASDYSAEWGMMWDENGMYFLFRVVDDLLVIEDDYAGTSAVPADQWWTDDNINILFSSDLVNNSFTQWEFAYQPGIDQEEKLSSDDWANAALIDISLVESAWHIDGTTYTLETFISWDAFVDFTGDIGAGLDIKLEMRARDDDDDGSWESMFQWSTDNYDIESDGVGFGTVTLSDQIVEGEKPVLSGLLDEIDLKVYPNPAVSELQVGIETIEATKVDFQVYDLSGRLQFTEQAQLGLGGEKVKLNVSHLRAGTYLLKTNIAGQSKATYFIKL